jgi:hypothetical protein
MPYSSDHTSRHEDQFFVDLVHTEKSYDWKNGQQYVELFSTFSVDFSLLNTGVELYQFPMLFSFFYNQR